MTTKADQRVSDTPRTVEDRIGRFLAQPGAYVGEPDYQFIAKIRESARHGVGYGFMQQVIEWEWQSKEQGAWGPEYFHTEIERLERELVAARRDIKEAMGYAAHHGGCAEYHGAGEDCVCGLDALRERIAKDISI